MKIQVFYIRDCPNYRPAVELVQDVLRAKRLTGEIEEIEIADVTEATQRRFLGSPTIRIDGLDIEPTARNANNYGFLCRMYIDGCCRSGLPSREMIQDALQRASLLNRN